MAVVGQDPYRPEIVRAWPGGHGAARHRAIDGSLLMVDVSGFTKLSERLAARGPIGAEELTEIVGTVFGGMLDDLRSWDGDVLTFGGDALLTLFSGERHEARASAAAMRIQAGMRPFRNFLTDAGRVSLRVSAGIASGPVDLFVVGRGEPIPCGGGTDRLAHLRPRVGSPGGRGRDLETPPRQACPPGSCQEPTPRAATPAGRSLRGSLSAGGLPGSPAPPTYPAPAPARPPPTLKSDAEHRLVTIGFVQFKGSDAVHRQGGPERPRR